MEICVFNGFQRHDEDTSCSHISTWGHFRPKVNYSKMTGVETEIIVVVGAFSRTRV